MFLLAAVSLKDAVKLAVLGEALSREVVCVPKGDANDVSEILAKMAE